MLLILDILVSSFHEEISFNAAFIEWIKTSYVALIEVDAPTASG